MRALERAVMRAAVELVNHDSVGSDAALKATVEAYLSDEARLDRPYREACGRYSQGWGMRCQRPANHPLDSDRSHEGFDRAGRRRHWKDW